MQKIIEDRLAHYFDPYLNAEWGACQVVKSVELVDHLVQIKVTLGYPIEKYGEKLVTALASWLQPVLHEYELEIMVSAQIDVHAEKPSIQPIPHIKNLIAIASGKGGVGKSTVAVNVALALASEGAKVGLLDADIYGPSQPAMTGSLNQKAEVKEGRLQPIHFHGMETISMGHLVDANTALSWRGPMLGKALEQLVHDTAWPALDYLIIDLPPGTGDVQLTLCQKMPVSGAVIVTTPQEMALHDVRRACDMFNKLNIPILGVVENMSQYHCTHCGHESLPFGQGGALALAKEFQLDVLGRLPLDPAIRELTDAGQPPVVSQPMSQAAQNFIELSRHVAGRLARRPKSYAARFPKIVVTHDKK